VAALTVVEVEVAFTVVEVEVAFTAVEVEAVVITVGQVADTTAPPAVAITAHRTLGATAAAPSIAAALRLLAWARPLRAATTPAQLAHARAALPGCLPSTAGDLRGIPAPTAVP